MASKSPKHAASALIVPNAILPQRAAFRSEPVVADSSRRQKLSNFVVRMAGESLVPVDVVIRDVLAWPQRSSSQVARQLCPFATGQRLELVNSTGDTARYWSDKANQLTGRADLGKLTLLDFASVLKDPSGLMTPQRRWCCACLHDDIEAGAPAYERLIWSVRLVTQCPIHEVRLQAKCVACGYVHNRELTRRAMSGMCGKCHRWLGRRGERNARPEPPTPDARREQWITRQLSDLLDLSSEQMDAVSQASVTAMLNAGIEALCDGNAKEFARLCGKAPSSLCEWRNGVAFPSLPAMLQLSWSFGIPLTALLTGDQCAWQLATPTQGATRLIVNKMHRTSFSRDWSSIARHVAERIEQSGSAESWADIAREVGVDASELRRRFPLLAGIVIERARRARADTAIIRRLRRRELIEALVRESIRELNGVGQRPTRRKLDAALRARGLTIRHAEYPLVRGILDREKISC